MILTGHHLETTGGRYSFIDAKSYLIGTTKRVSNQIPQAGADRIGNKGSKGKIVGLLSGGVNGQPSGRSASEI
jgi:hypothetical protein